MVGRLGWAEEEESTKRREDDASLSVAAADPSASTSIS